MKLRKACNHDENFDEETKKLLRTSDIEGFPDLDLARLAKLAVAGDLQAMLQILKIAVAKNDVELARSLMDVIVEMKNKASRSASGIAFGVTVDQLEAVRKYCEMVIELLDKPPLFPRKEV